MKWIRPLKLEELVAGNLGYFKIVKSNKDGTVLQDIYVTQNPIIYLSLSPDGKKLAFETFPKPFTRLELGVMNVDGTGFKIIHKDVGLPFITWSPDSSRILFYKTTTYYVREEYVYNGRHVYGI